MAREDAVFITQSLNDAREMLTIDHGNLLLPLELAIKRNPAVSTQSAFVWQCCFSVNSSSLLALVLL
jgi:hypothetical protein